MWAAPAKINLSLRVLARRADGFHDLETLMVPLELADEITLERSDHAGGETGAAFALACSDPSLPAGRENLALRAAELFVGRTGARLPPLRIGLTKRIPHGAGLGGGSSDAATVLLALNEFAGTGLDAPALAQMAAELGSDVPFFIYRGAAVCRGRGDVVAPLDVVPAVELLLLKPPFPVPTPWAYRRWAQARELPGVRYAAQSFAWGALVNDLERPVFEKYLVLADIKMWLLDRPEVAGALLSGSGSTMLAILRASAGAGELARAAEAEFGPLWTWAGRSRPRDPAVGGGG